jgi:L-rhamnose-H+ transport protein
MVGTASAWALLIVAGAANAAFGLPMKYVRRWEWENTWAVWSLLALIVLPAVLALSCVPSLTAVYRGEVFETTEVVFLLGAGWGLAQVLFGKAMHTIGIGLTFSIVLGLSAAAGSILPMLRLGTGSSADAKVQIAVGLVLVALGVAACAEAGRRRERARAEDAHRPGSFLPGLLMAVCSGILASFMNLGIAFGGPLIARASAHGASEANSVYAVWLPLLLGGAVPNLLYCAYLLGRRKTWARFAGASLMLNLCLAATMAVLWFFSTALYGMASHELGAWGVVLGWPVFMSVIVIGAGLLGIATGEWSHSGTAPVMFQSAGILLLVMAIVAFSRAQHTLPHSEAASVGILMHSARHLLSEAHVR